MSKTSWKWFGNAGHFICADQCQFHLCTLVGKYLISTVGELFPDAPVREIYAEARGVRLEGKGDARKADYMRKVGYGEIGCDRKYETMVFLAGKPCAAEGCGCGLPRLYNGRELDFLGYNDAGSATKGHMKMCEKWDKKKQ